MTKWFLPLLAGCALLAGCTMQTSITGNKPTGVSASTRPPKSIEVYWTRDPTDITPDTVILLNNGLGFDTTIVAYPIDSAFISGLISGTTYTIIIGTVTGRSLPYHYPFGVTNVPTNVSVTSIVGLTITIGWTRTPTDTTTDTLFVLDSIGALADPIVITMGSTGSATGLLPGQRYIIIVASATGRSTAISYTVPGIPFKLMVNAMSVSSIGAKWSRGISDNGVDTIVAMNGTTVVSTATVSAPDTTGVVTGLSEGVQYGISIHMSTGISDTITWMTAERTPGIKIYEMADTLGDPRGLQLTAPAAKAIVLPGAVKPDLVLAEDTAVPSRLSLDAGDSANANGNATMINPNYIFVRGGLNNNYRDSNYTSSLSAVTVTPIVIPNDSGDTLRGSLVLMCQTVNSNLALIEIVPDATTSRLYSISSNGFKYITVNVSYQNAANTPYAGRGRPRYAKPAPKKPSGNVKPIASHPVNNIKSVLRNPPH